MLIDSHCHLPHRKYEKTPEQLIEDAAKDGVTKIINIGTSLDENSLALEVSSQFENVYSVLGIYPHEERGKNFDDLMTSLELQLSSSPKVVGIGECGIDITEWENGRPLDEQLDLFEHQLQLAVKKQLPVVIHNNNGDEHIIRLLSKYVPAGLTGVAHCFSSDSWNLAQNFLDLGFYISFAGKITYNSRRSMLDVVAKVPLERILVETDAPYLPPDGFRGTVNEPARVIVTAKKIAQVKNIEFAKLAEFTYSNTCKLFNLPNNL